MNEHDATEQAYKNGYKQGIKDMQKRLIEKAYQSSDWSHGEHPLVVEIDDINEIVQELLEGKNND